MALPVHPKMHRLPKVDEPMLHRLLDLAMIDASEERFQFLLFELNRQSVVLEEVLDAVDRIEAGGDAAEPTMYGVSFTEEVRQELREDRVEEYGQAASIRNGSPRLDRKSFFVVPAAPDAPADRADDEE